jgi:eukaryotic-like serine/threonine-protein kinase
MRRNHWVRLMSIRVNGNDMSMSAGTEPTRRPPPRVDSEGATVGWLDALAGGNCTTEDFLAAMQDQFQGDRDEGWEVLSLLDQYYRRGKIKSDLFHTVKGRLEGLVLKGAEAMVVTPIRPRVASAAVEPVAAVRRRASDPRPAGREVAIGDVLRDRYRVSAVLGHGGMGTVFEAIDEYRLELPTAGRQVAIKVLHAAVTRRDELLAELRREFQHLQLLSHPNIVRVHEFDRDGDVAFFTMELLSGALLSRVLGARHAVALPRADAFAIMRDTGAALTHAHTHGVVHGDINPRNIFITNEGEVRVLDFGASHKLPRDWRDGDGEFPRHAPIATPGYASCQLLEGQHPDARDDLFAFACVAYVLLSGQHPFPNRTAIEARAQRVRPRRPQGLSGRQWRVLREGLRWEREKRPSDIQKWLERFDLRGAASRVAPLTALSNAPPPHRPFPVFAAAAIVLLALLATAGYWAATDYDSLQRRVMDLGGRARAALANAGGSPATSGVEQAPVTAAQTAPDAASVPPSLPAQSTTAASAVPSSVPARASAGAPPAATPTAAATPTTTSARAPARAGAADPSASWPIRIELAADTVDVQPGETTAQVIVRRRGNPRGAASFSWWTESGTAKPARDFAPVMPRVETIADGRGSISLTVPVSGKARSQPISFYVVIDQADSGPAMGARTLTMVTLLPTD